MPRRRPGSPGTASGPGFRRDPGHETAPGINGHPRAGKVPDPARISRMACVGAAPPTLWIVNQALASGVGFPDIRGVGCVAPTAGLVAARPPRKDSRQAAQRAASIARHITAAGRAAVREGVGRYVDISVVGETAK